jgi:hypothetical protein
MIKDLEHIRYRRFVFSVNDYFLSREARLDADLNYCIQCPENIDHRLQAFHTLLIDLSQPVERIKEAVYHRTLTEINSFISNQSYEHKVLFPVPEKELKNCIALFDEFARTKKIRKAEAYRLKEYNKQGILALTYVKLDDQFLCVNFYRLTKQRAANLYSFTGKQASDKQNGSLLGRAHRALHWLDILEFKRSGVNYYDFCGWYDGTTNKDLLNINKFKEQFTKNIVKEYTGVIYKNKLLIFLSKLIH